MREQLKKRVFIVEDDDLLTLFAKSSLNKIVSESEIETFISIAEVRKAIESGGFPDFIVCDNDLGANNEKGTHFAVWLLKQNYKNFVIWTGSAEAINKMNPAFRVIEKNNYGDLEAFVREGVN